MGQFQEHRYQVQQRDSAKAVAEYERDGVPQYAETEWSNRLKKSYPMKSASKEFNYCLSTMAAAGLRDYRLIDTKTGRVLDQYPTGGDV